MSEREARVVEAFLECVRAGRFDPSYVTLLVEDNQKYGWMSETAKETLFAAMENIMEEPEEIPEEPEDLDGPYLGDADLDDLEGE